jgi:hypothetical protein
MTIGPYTAAATAPSAPSDGLDRRTRGCDLEDWSAFANFIRRRLEAGSTDLSAESLFEIDRVLLPAVLEFTDADRGLSQVVIDAEDRALIKVDEEGSIQRRRRLQIVAKGFFTRLPMAPETLSDTFTMTSFSLALSG